jgi:serine/threonine protein kinase
MKFVRKELHDSNKTSFWLEQDNLARIQKITEGAGHLVHMLKSYRHGSVYNIIFPCAKMNLNDFLRDQGNYYSEPPRVSKSWNQMLGICRALCYMIEGPCATGEKTFVGYHFDLKPANILVFGDGTWQIADFGQAVFRERTGSSAKITNPGGTDAYAPPEAVDLKAKGSRKYDVWSMGCILLELTSFLAKGGPHGLEALDQARYTEYQRGSDHRLWKRAGDEAFMLKPSVSKFLESLPALFASSPEDRQFLEKILVLIIWMLEPVVESRCSASNVVTHLGMILEEFKEPIEELQSSLVLCH